MMQKLEDLEKEVESLRKDRNNLEACYSRENDEIRTKVALLEKDVSYGNEKVESLSQAKEIAEAKTASLEAENGRLKALIESYKADIKKLENDASRATRDHDVLIAEMNGTLRQREAEVKEACSREKVLTEEILLYKTKLELSEKQVATLEGNVASEKASVAKYKRMVGEIGRLVNWAQTSAPGSAAVTAALAAARSTGEENGGKPSPAAQAALRVARMSLTTGTGVLGDTTNTIR